MLPKSVGKLKISIIGIEEKRFFIIYYWGVLNHFLKDFKKLLRDFIKNGNYFILSQGVAQW